jgi:hypothetical protein
VPVHTNEDTIIFRIGRRLRTVLRQGEAISGEEVEGGEIGREEEGIGNRL